MTSPWSLVVPVKPVGTAKSRMATLPHARREALVVAMAADTVAAALACPLVVRLLVVTDDERVAAAVSPLGAMVTADVPAAGLNAALRHGTDAVRSGAYGPEAPVGLLSGDLPALRPEELRRALDAAAAHARAFVADAAGTGTTLVTAAPGIAPDPHFGAFSRARHLDSGAVELDVAVSAGLRRDVDTLADLDAALGLGVGPHTAAWADAPADTKAGRNRRM